MCVINIYNIFIYSHLDYSDVYGKNGVIKDTEMRTTIMSKALRSWQMAYRHL